MALPPALLARLQKRGIVGRDPNEEVFAEDYGSDVKEKKVDDREFAIGCPNKNNPYHVCVEFCYDHWGDGQPESRLNEEYLYRKNRMLTRYPIPEPWVEVYDPGMKRHYYWNPESDEVCWLSPRHPNAVIGEAAPKLARERAHGGGADDSRPPMPPQAPLFDQREAYRQSEEARQRDRYSDRNRDRERDDRRDRGRDRDRHGRDRERDRRPPRRSPGQSDSDEGKEEEEPSDRDRLRRATRKGIDPMDPAAYSDISVGRWSSGLVEDTKTGVDTTAGGPLFQQRPYPAPGAILARSGKKRPGDDDD
ncbi:unnamed protein product, partial [Mesorhabditis spiculigera]